MIPLYSTTIRRREMDGVLTCMVDEKIGPGQMNARLVQVVKDFFVSAASSSSNDTAGAEADKAQTAAKRKESVASLIAGAVPLRSPAIALRYALEALGIERGSAVMISALAPSWQLIAAEQLGMRPVVLDVDKETGLAALDKADAGVKAGGKVLLLHETSGLVPDMDAFLQLGVPIIEDISQSAGAAVSVNSEDGESERRMAGTCGAYSILGLEEHDAVTAGGGAVLIAPHRREWSVLKHLVDDAPSTDLLPDLNSALAVVELKEFVKNEERRCEIYSLYQRTLLNTNHSTFPRDTGGGDTASSFPVVLAHSYMDAKQYANKKEVEIQRAFGDCVIAKRDEELSATCMNAKSLFLSTVLFPLYARLTSAQAEKIVKVLGSMP